VACLYFDLSADSAIVLNPYYPGNPNQQWERADPFIHNRGTPNKVLDIASEYSDASKLKFYRSELLSANSRLCDFIVILRRG